MQCAPAAHRHQQVEHQFLEKPGCLRLDPGQQFGHHRIPNGLSGSATLNVAEQAKSTALVWFVVPAAGSASLGCTLSAAGLARVVVLLRAGALINRYTPAPVLRLASVVSAALGAAAAFGIVAGVFDAAAPFVVGVTLAVFLAVFDGLHYPADAALTPATLAAHHLPAENALLRGLVESAHSPAATSRNSRPRARRRASGG